MATNKSPVKPVFSLKLLVDKKKNKVVLAEAGKDFVDVLFSFLALPMGTIVRLLEKYQPNKNFKVSTIGCFNMLYKSVFDLGVDNFTTEACKDMLLHPRTVMEKELRGLKLNIDDIVALKYTCNSCRSYSNFPSTKCPCGRLMQEEQMQRGYDKIFASNKTLFTITDKMEVGFTSMSLTLMTLKDLGYTDAGQLHQMTVDVDQNKVLGLLQSLFTSDTPLTDVLLQQASSCVSTKPNIPLKEGIACPADSKSFISVSVFARKVDKKVLYVESEKDFVDILVTFLVLRLLPLKFAWELSGSNILLGCIGNLCESFKSMSSNETGNIIRGKCMLPWYYSCHQPLLDVCYANRDSGHSVMINGNVRVIVPNDPRNGTYAPSAVCSGFVKAGKTFMIADDLSITPMDLLSNVSLLMKWNIRLDDIEEHKVNISKTEAIRLLRATFLTSTALNTVFGSLHPKKPKEEKH